MRMRMGAPLLVALVSLLAATGSASASYCGACGFSIFQKPSCDAQTCFSPCQEQNKVVYKLVYDTVTEKRWHTTYKTVQETVCKQVTKTCYKDECKTMYRTVQKCCYKDVVQECTRPVHRCVVEDVPYTCYKQVMETHVKACEYQVCRKVPKICEKEVCEVVCKPVYEQHCHVACHQVQRQVCENHVKECCETICRPVCETHYKNVCSQVCKCVQECHTKEVCCNVCHDVCETCYKDCCKKVCKQVCTMKCVSKKVKECCEETYCKPGRTHTVWTEVCDCCVDPCSCKCEPTVRRVRTTCKEPDQICTRKVWHTNTVNEMVPCTTTVYENVVEKVPFTVTKKVTEVVKKQVPYTTTRQVRGCYVDSKGNNSEAETSGCTFKEGAVCTHQVPYTVQKMVTEVVKKEIPYTVTRCLTGAWVDDKGVGHDTEAPGRNFKEGAQVQTTQTYTTCRNVQETRVKKVQYTVCENVMETCVKNVPYQTCRMVPVQMTKKVSRTVCDIEKFTVCKKVPYTVCETVPYTVHCKVPYTVCESVPCTVCKKVPVCVCEDVCVKVCRKVPVACEPACPCTTCDPCQDKCSVSPVHQRAFSSMSCNCGSSCDSGKHESFLQRLFRNRFCCEPTSSCCGGGCADGSCGASATPVTAPAGTVVPKAMPNKN